MSIELELSVVREGGAFALTATGEIDLSNSESLLAAARLALDSPGCSSVDIDLAGVPFIDSTGLSVLLIISNECTRIGVDFAMHNMTRPVRLAVTASGLSRVLSVEPSDPTIT
jgi:anti-anti-sigma factor